MASVAWIFSPFLSVEIYWQLSLGLTRSNLIEPMECPIDTVFQMVPVQYIEPEVSSPLALCICISLLSLPRDFATEFKMHPIWHWWISWP